MNKQVTDRRTLGVNFNTEGTATLLFWVPEANTVAVRFNQHEFPLLRAERGYWNLTTDVLQPETNYEVIIDGKAFPDIYSLCQPDGVHGVSLAIKLSDYQWTDDSWSNPPLDDYLIYEIHTGTFTPEGTFNGIIQKLDHLKTLGITAIELMPVAQFPGERNWGYDGVFPFSVQQSYGAAGGLQQLVDACHAKGLAVILDVVFNHIGPEGNYLGQYGPYFTDKYKTPWGDAINFDDAGCDEVRRYFLENALMWFRDFHIDALRLDAVHAIKDFSPKHFLKELKEQINELEQLTGRTNHLIIECDLNDHRFIDPLPDNGYGMNAQWIDEFHHALRVCAGEKKQGYYSDFDGLDSLKAAYDHAYVYNGQYSAQRRKSFGTDPSENPGKQFIVFSQNHDQVGNRMLGERSGALYSFEMQKLLAAAVMISPFIPMLFMGEEYSEPNPFLYFVSHSDPELISAVSKGRKAEFAAFHHEGDVPDPQAETTFLNSKLQWDKLDHTPHQTIYKYYQALIRLRKTHPALRNPDRKNIQTVAHTDKGTLIIIRSGGGLQLHCILNFSGQKQSFSLPGSNPGAQLIFNSAASDWNGLSNHVEPLPAGSIITLPPESILIFEQHV